MASYNTVWKNEKYLGKGLILQQANYSDIKNSHRPHTYEKSPDPEVTKVDGEYVYRYRIVHMSDVVENYDEINESIEQKIGAALTK